MKNIFVILFMVLSISVKSQKNVIPIYIFQDKPEMEYNDTLMFLVKKHAIPHYSTELISLSKIVDTIKILTKKKINFSIVSREIKFNNFESYIFIQQTTIINKNSKRKLNKKLMFCYMTTDKDTEGNYIFYFYSVE